MILISKYLTLEIVYSTVSELAMLMFFSLEAFLVNNDTGKTFPL